ncbi:MAG: tetratricopeptide repeat protein [Deltaproteobacteria bacterium]|nr:tetratricopeptide repeat protein [Deltaproteobacteria bacterium]
MKKLALVSIAILCWPALLQAGDLTAAQSKLDAMDFPGALELAEQVLGSSEVGPGELVDAYRIQGLCLSAMQQTDASLAAFRKALSIDPSLSLSTDTSPKLAAPFYQAQAIARELRPISLHHDEAGPRAGGDDRERRVRLEGDPMRLVKGIRLCHASGTDWRCDAAVEVSEPGEFGLRLPPAAGDAPVRYCFEATSTHGGVLARAGSRDKPFGAGGSPIAVQAGDRPELGATGPIEQEPVGREPAAVWYEQWWFWTAVGVVVVGAAVGVGVGVGTSGSGSPSYQVSVD